MTYEEASLAFAEDNYSPIPRLARTIPFGYVQDENDPDLLLPIPLELEALEKARQHLRQYSYREVAHWLEEVTGRKISHVGLKKRIETENARNRKSNVLNIIAKRAEEARAKAEKFSKEKVRRKNPSSDS